MLATLRTDQPFLQFFEDTMILHTDVSFLPRAVTDFRIDQLLLLLTLFFNPSNETERMLHTLDVRRALAFYVSKTKQFRSSMEFFCVFWFTSIGVNALQMVCLYNFIVLLPSAKDPPQELRAHFIRAVASSTALLRGIDVPHVCRTARWS